MPFSDGNDAGSRVKEERVQFREICRKQFFGAKLMTTTTSLFDLKGRVAVITGGNGGIGRGIAIGFAQAGASVAILGRNEDKNAAVLAELQAIGRPCMALRLDVTDRDSLAPAMNQVESQLGPIDILVNNAGVATPTGGVLHEPAENWDKTIETHLNASFLLSQIAARSMVTRQRGKIINIASMYSIFGAAMVPSYGAAKGGMVQLTKAMAVELAAHNIQVNAIAPGWITTEMTIHIPEHVGKTILARTPARRWGQPDDLAGAAVFLSSAASDFVTGIVLPVDGGYSVC